MSDPVVVAVVPAKDSEATVAATVGAIRAAHGGAIVVVDDGSTDGTAAAASSAGARVLRLPRNRGKGGAVAAAVEATPDADVYLLIDADVGVDPAAVTAAVGELLSPVLAGDAEMTVGVLPGAGGRGGFGLVRRMATAAIKRGTGYEAHAPLSGQRAVRAELLRNFDLAARFGLETALTLDAAQAGARIAEVPVGMDHLHTGRSAAGFAHRARQGADIVRAVWPRLTTEPMRIAAIALAVLVFLAAASWSGTRWEPSSVPAPAGASKVVVIGVPGLSWTDAERGHPGLRSVLDHGAVGALGVRTLSKRPAASEGYATLGAGNRAKAPAGPVDARDRDGGGVDVAGMAMARAASRGRHLSTLPGALGSALHRAGRVTAVVGNPAAALAIADDVGRVDAGTVSAGASDLVDATRAAVSVADVVVADPTGITDADRFVADVAAVTPPGTTVMVVSVTPPSTAWDLTPAAISGTGSVRGEIVSPSTKRLGLLTLTDVAPTILSSAGVAVPDGMVGHAVRFHPGTPDVARLAELNRDALFRERIYYPVALTFIIIQALFYGLTIAVLRRPAVDPARAERWLRPTTLAFAAFPLATFVFRAFGDVARLGPPAVLILIALDLVLVGAALRLRGDRFRALRWLFGLTVAVLVIDVCTGARLQTASIMGYSPHTATRFFGIGNTAFAVLAGATVLLGGLHLERAPRRREALVSVAALFLAVTFVDGAPSLGDDVGGILTLVPVLGLTFVALTGRRVTWRTIGAFVAGTVALVAVAIGIDLLRPPEARTHLGRLVADIGHDGARPLIDTVSRKVSTNIRVFTATVWTWMVPIMTTFMLMLLVVQHRWGELLPRRSARRAAVIGALAAGLLGFALNDSGVVITALVLVMVGPVLTQAAVGVDPPSPVWVEPESPAITAGASSS